MWIIGQNGHRPAAILDQVRACPGLLSRENENQERETTRPVSNVHSDVVLSRIGGRVFQLAAQPIGSASRGNSFAQ